MERHPEIRVPGVDSRQLVKRLGYTDSRGYDYALIHLDVLLPDPKNPRIPLQESVEATILELVRQDVTVCSSWHLTLRPSVEPTPPSSTT